MKPEPLQREQTWGEAKENNSWGYSKNQIKSAVKFFKKEFKQMIKKLDNYQDLEENTDDLIDKAFEDIK